MSRNSHEMICAIKNGQLVYIDDVSGGAECGCICPACGGRLLAKKGLRRIHHFAHASGETCSYGCETSLHLSAKEILSRANKIWIPPAQICFRGRQSIEVVSKGRYVKIDKVELEKRMDDIVPDVIVYCGNKKFLVEIYVTHKVDEEKLGKIIEQNISVLEIDLSNQTTITKDVLEEIVIGQSANKVWRYNNLAEEQKKRLLEFSEELIVQRGRMIDKCPITKRIEQGREDASVTGNCQKCRFLFDIKRKHGEAVSIICSGKSAVACMKDIELTEDARKKKYGIREYDIDDIKKKICPVCGSKLVEREGKYGKFMGCSQFPKCRFKTKELPDAKKKGILLKLINFFTN